MGTNLSFLGCGDVRDMCTPLKSLDNMICICKHSSESILFLLLFFIETGSTSEDSSGDPLILKSFQRTIYCNGATLEDGMQQG